MAAVMQPRFSRGVLLANPVDSFSVFRACVAGMGNAHFPKHSLEYSLNFRSLSKKKEWRQRKTDVFCMKTKVLSRYRNVFANRGCGQSLVGWWGYSAHVVFLPVCYLIVVMVDGPACPPMFLTPFVGDFRTLSLFLQLHGLCLSGIACTGSFLEFTGFSRRLCLHGMETA